VAGGERLRDCANNAGACSPLAFPAFIWRSIGRLMPKPDSALQIALGIAGSFATARLAEATVSGLLFGLKINDATVIVFAAVVLVAVATLAGLVPARERRIWTRPWR
jgi:hypothetical protein